MSNKTMNDKLRLDLSREQLETLLYALDNVTQLAHRAYLDNPDWEHNPAMREERAKLLEHEQKFKALRELVGDVLTA